MPLPKDIDSISSYLRAWARELGERILGTYPPLQSFEDPPIPARWTAPPQAFSRTNRRNYGRGKAME